MNPIGENEYSTPDITHDILQLNQSRKLASPPVVPRGHREQVDRTLKAEEGKGFT